eukprot:scaffold4869_cov33-Tisochrysis_lutea.AAC.4
MDGLGDGRLIVQGPPKEDVRAFPVGCRAQCVQPPSQCGGTAEIFCADRCKFLPVLAMVRRA